MSATRLERLRRDLEALARRRRLERRGSALAAAILAVLAVLGALFLADRSFEMDRVQRAVAAAAGLIALAWAILRFSLSLLGRREDLIDMALLVERRERIDTDLVASIEFESEDAPRWGSRQLEEAVIGYVADYAKEVDVFRGFSWRPLARRAGAAGAALAVAGLLAIRFPDHAGAFLDRLLLGGRHYPTRTVIEEIAMNGILVLPAPAGAPAARAASGRPLQIEVRASGRLPEKGRAELETLAGGLRTSVDLLQAGDSGTFRGEFARLAESVRWQVFLGDAWTDPLPLEVIPLPAVNVELEVIPPEYARGRDGSGGAPGSRQVAVLEGSRVTLRALSANKPLAGAIAAAAGGRFPLAPADGGMRIWSLAPEGTPFAAVAEPIAYTVEATDADGLGLDEPIAGSIRIRPDRPPGVVAAVVSRHVLPSARPAISYGATDDFGIALLKVRRERTRGEEKTDLGEEIIPVPPGGPPPAVLRGRHVLDLGPLELRKDDQLAIVVEAVDFRGSLPGRSAASEPLVLLITDERGVLAAMMESDEKSARQLDQIIERQLGVGETR